MAKLHQSHMHHEVMLKKNEETEDDPCPMCKKDLYLDDEYSQRIGLLDDDEEICGWMCPHCDGMFDNEDNLTGIFGYPLMGKT